MVLIITWLAFATLSGIIARQRGRSIALWTALGFGAGVIALGVVALLPDSAGHQSNWGVSALMRAAERLDDHNA